MAWDIAEKAAGTRAVCYCRDCQAFDAHLKGGRRDVHGGTHIFQTLPNEVRITFGDEHLACLRLGPRGLIRWYANCCGTPLANTLPRPGLPFIGMILPEDATGFGKIKARVHTQHARTKVKEFGFNAAGFALLRRGLVAKLSGQGNSPFFNEDGSPIRTPDILTQEQRRAATP